MILHIPLPFVDLDTLEDVHKVGGEGEDVAPPQPPAGGLRVLFLVDLVCLDNNSQL